MLVSVPGRNLNLFSALCRCRVFCYVLGTGLLLLCLLHADDPSFLLFARVKLWTCLLVSKHLLIDFFFFFNSLPFCSPQVTSFSAGSAVVGPQLCIKAGLLALMCLPVSRNDLA